MSNSHKNDLEAAVRIGGMHCASCEILLERKLRAIKGIKRASVDHKTGIAKLTADPRCAPGDEKIRAVVEDAGYRLLDDGTGASPSGMPDEQPGKKWLEIGGALLIIFAFFKLFSAFNLVSLAPSTPGAASSSSASSREPQAASPSPAD